MSIKASNTAAIKRATARSWDQWITQRQGLDGQTLPHPQLATLALSLMPEGLQNPEWWAQSVAVAFEQHLGRRIPGQASDGTFHGSVSVSTTGTLDEALSRWLTLTADVAEFNKQQCAAEPKISSTERWRYWRASFGDGTKASVNISSKGEKVTVAVEHSQASSVEALEQWKSFWRQLLPSMKS